jgi:hypothetical protein
MIPVHNVLNESNVAVPSHGRRMAIVSKVALHPRRRGAAFDAPAYQCPPSLPPPPVFRCTQLELLLDDRRDDDDRELDDDLALDDDRALELETAARELLEPGGSSGIVLGLLPQLAAGTLSPAPASPAMVIPIAASTGPMWFATPRLRVPRSAPHRSPTTLPAALTMTDPESP